MLHGIQDRIVPPIQPQTKRCPFCAEEISASATECNHCDSRLTTYNPVNPPRLVRSLKKPVKVKAIAIMELVGGIIHCLIGAWWLIAGLSVFLVGVVLTIVPAIYMVTLGIMEIINATNLLPDPIKIKQPRKSLAVMEICAIAFCSVGALVIGILSLVFYKDEEVQRYFAGANQ